MKKILVTGAGGMVGSHMIESLTREDYEVVGTYYKPTINIGEIKNGRAKLIECDVRYPQSVQQVVMDFMPDTIFHLAAQSYPTVSWERPYETMDINIGGTLAVFETIKFIRSWKMEYDPMVVVACSSAEYGHTLDEIQEDAVFVKETALLQPLHPYGVSKVAQDLLAFQYYMNDHIRCIRARIFNSTGTRKVNDVTSDFTRRAVLAERDGSYQISVGNLETRRANMDQRDLIRALVLLAEKGAPGECYNISSEVIYRMRDIVTCIEECVGHPYKLHVEQGLLRQTDEKIIAGDVTKLKKDTNWKQEISIKETVQDMLEYWRKVLPVN